MTSAQNFLIVSIIPHDMTNLQAFYELKELKDLVNTYGGKVHDFITQNREVHDKGDYIGKGKILEINKMIKNHPIDAVVLNTRAKPGQLFSMKTIWQKSNPNIEVWDRIDLILHIFSKRAKTAEAKLQIELAAMRHMGPRIYGMGKVLSRQAGNIGTRGVGETNTELMKRHWREQMKVITDKLAKLDKDRNARLNRRPKKI